MDVPFFRSLPPFAPRPTLVIVVLALAGFLIDLFVQPVSTEGFLLILLAASPFLLELLRPANTAEIAKADIEVAQPSTGRAAPARAPEPAARPAAPARPTPLASRPVAPRPVERQPAPGARGAPRPPQQPEPARTGAQRPAPRRDEADRIDRHEPAKLL